jgi:hypothetical protein
MDPRPGRPTRRRRNRVENDDYAAFTQRVIAAHGRRIAQGDIEGLTTLAALATDIDHALQQAITGLREAGYSWAVIGDRLGITRQAAQQRFSTPTGGPQ